MPKIVKRIILAIVVLIVLAVVGILGFLGYIPGLSSLLGANKPRDLGIEYTAADLASSREKSQIEYQYGSLPDDTPDEASVKYEGSREVTATFTSAEITASLNNQDYKYWPFEDVQVRFNDDGSGEISGVLDKSKVPGFAAAIDFPSNIAERAMDFLPPDPAFYVKMTASLEDNKVKTFEPQTFQIGRISLPVGMFLSLAPEPFIQTAYAESLSDVGEELDKVENKKAWIISYINRRLAAITGVYAEEAYFDGDGLHYDGTLTEQISTVD